MSNIMSRLAHTAKNTIAAVGLAALAVGAAGCETRERVNTINFVYGGRPAHVRIAHQYSSPHPFNNSECRIVLNAEATINDGRVIADDGRLFVVHPDCDDSYIETRAGEHYPIE